MLNKLRYILLTLLLIAATQAAGQYIIDKVCVGSVRYYRVDGESGSTYIWKVTDPLNNVTTLTSTADTVAITWNVVTGIYKLSTIQHSVVTNCDGVIEIGDIEVFNQPLAFAGNPKIYCAPGPYQLSEATASNYSSLLWTTPGDGTFNNDTILHPVYTPGSGDLLAGSVTLTLTAKGMGNGTGCTPAISSMTITIIPNVIAGAGPNDTSCANYNYVINSAFASNYSSLHWSHNGLGTLTGSATVNPTYIPAFNETGVVTFYLRAYSLPPCTDSIIDQMTLIIHPLPTGTIVLLSGDTVCGGDTIRLRIDLTGTPPWAFNFTDGTTTTNITNLFTTPYFINTNPDSTVTYSLIFLSDANCTALPGSSNSVKVHVHPKPAVQYTWTLGPQNYQVNFHIDSSITNLGSIGYLVLWNFGDGTFGYGNNPIHFYPGSTTFHCIMTVTDTNGCQNSVMHEIFVPPVQIAFYSSTAPTCLGSPMCFTDLSTVPNPPATYIQTWIWNFGDGTPPITIQFPDNPNVCHTYASIGTYPVSLAIKDNWGTTTSYVHDQSVIPSPVAYFTYSSNCQGQPVQFTDASTLSGGGNITTWNWDFGNPTSGINNTSTLQNPIHLFTGSNTFYNVTLSILNLNGCRDTLVKTVYILARPTVEFTHDSACDEQVVHFVADPGITHIDSIVSWSWDFGDGSSPVTNPGSATHTYTAPGTFIATLTVTDHHGCINSVSHGVRVNPLPFAEFSWSGPACSGSPVHYTDNSSVPLGYTGFIAKWLWDFGDGTSQLVTLPGSPNVTHTFVGNGMTHTVRLTVWTSDSCSQFIEHGINSIPGPTADFNTSNIHCTSSPVQFTDASLTNGGGSISQWQWNFNDPLSGINNTSTLQNPTHTYFTSGIYNVRLIVTNLSGCTDTIIKTVDINVAPLADFRADTVCLNSVTQFTDLSSPNGGTIITRTWDFGDGSAISHQQNPTHTYALSGVFNVKLTVVNSNGCSKDTTRAVMVNPLPLAAFSYSTPNCLGAVVHYTNLSTTPAGYLGSIVQWVWDFGDGTTTTINAPVNPDVSHAFAGTALSHIVRLTVTTSDGCSAYIEHTINSIPAPIADFGFPSLNCNAQSVQFSDLTNTNGGGAIISWSWNFGDPVSGLNNISNQQNPAHQFTSSGVYSVSLIISNTSGCTDTILKTVTISPSPLANFTSDTVCFNQATQFNDLSIANSSGIIGWVWDFGDGSPLSTSQNPTKTYLSYGIKNVKLTITNSNGCVKDTTKAVLVRPLPIAAFVFSANNCHGSAVQFTDQSSVVPGYLVAITQWTWNFGDGTPPVTILSPNNPNVTHIYTGSANAYTVRLTVNSSEGCSAYIEHTVTIMAGPSAEFTYPSGGCAQQAVQFTDASQTNGGGAIIQWQWNFGDPVSGLGNTSALQNPSHQFTASGTYSVTEIITNGSGCSDTITHTVTITPAPVANFTADTACLGAHTTFTDLSSTLTGSITQHLWDFGDGTTSMLINPVHQYLTNGTFQVRLTITTQNGCIKDTTKTVLVLPAPVAAFSASGPTCLGQLVNFNDNSYSMYGSIHTWVWDFGDGVSISINDPISPNLSHLYQYSGTYNVVLRITTSNGCSATTMNPVVVQPLPVANYTYTSIQCERIPVQFTNNSQNNGGTPVTQWLWNFDDPGSGLQNSSAIPNPVHTFSGTGIFNVVLTITSADGCVNTVTKPVTISARPIAKFSADTSCAHTPTQFTDHSIPNAQGILSWHWDFGDPSSGTNNSSTLQNPSHIYSSSGNYFVRLTVINTNLCQKDTLSLIPVPSAPIAMFQFSSSCMNTQTHFTDLSMAPNSQIIAWLWDFGDGIGTSNVQNPVYSYTTAGTFIVKLRMTNLSNCVDSISIPVISYPLPMAAYGYTNYFCPAGQVTFTDQSHGVGSAITDRLWIFEPGSTSTQHDPTYIFPVTDTTYIVTLIVTDDKGCKDTTTENVYVKPAFSLAFTNDTVCFKNTTHFHAHNNAQGDGLYAIQWNFGDPGSGANNTSTLTDPVHVFSSQGTFNVKLKARNTDNCVDSIYQTVIVHSLPTPAYTYVSPPCNNIIQFTDQSSAGNGSIISWTWDFGDGSAPMIIVPPASGSTTHTYGDPGIYRVILKVTNTNGCSDTAFHLVDRPSCITAAFIQSVAAACANAPVTFTDNSMPANQINQWHWTFGDGLDTIYTNFAHAIRHTYTNPGIYQVRLMIRAGVSGQTFNDTTGSLVTIIASPQVQFSAAPVCLNQITLFKDQTNAFGSEIATWRWNFGDPAAGTNNFSNNQDASHKYNSVGKFDASLMVINKLGCRDSLTKTTKVLRLPGARFINTLACSDNPTYFFDRSVAIDTTIENWHWNFGVPQTGKDTSQLKDPVYKYKKEGNYNVLLVVKDNNGCYDTVDSTITVNPTPLSAFIVMENVSNMTGKIQLRNKSEKAESYFWEFGNGYTSTDENPYVTYNKDGTYTIMLISSNHFGCADTTFLNYDVLFKGLYVPNAFAPSTDIQGVNVFKPVGVNLREYNVKVFDSWGHLVWESSDIDGGGRPTGSWNGRKDNGELYQQGSYAWVIRAIFTDGTIWEGSNIGKGDGNTMGTVTLIR